MRNAEFTLLRDLVLMKRAKVILTRGELCAITRRAQARPGAALILGGLLLLTLP